MRRFLPAAVLVLAACGGDGSTPSTADAGGTLVIATPADADVLFPPLTQTGTGRAVTDNVFERLADIGDALNTIGDEGFVPKLATGWTWAPDSMSVAFAIDPQARWHDGTPVTAEDVRFTFQLVSNPVLGSPTAPLLGNVDSVTVRDPQTAVAWFRRRTPERFYDVAYQLFVLPRHLLADIPVPQLRASGFARAPVGSGPFRFVRWEPGARLELRADTTHPRGRPGLDRVIWTIVPEPAAALAQLEAGEADLVDNLRPEQIADLDTAAIAVRQYPTLGSGYLLFNTRAGSAPHPLFGDTRVRRAVGFAIDRAAFAHNVFDSLGTAAHGPVPSSLPSALPGPAPAADPAHARALLDSAGWLAGPDGVRRRNGRSLAFRLLVPSQSRARVRLAVLAQEALRGIGVAAEVQQVDFPAFNARVERHDFDAAVQSWQTDPSPFGQRQMWGGAAIRGGGGSNFGGFDDPRFDALMDSAEVAATPAQATALLRRAWQVIEDEMPAVFIVEPRLAMGLHRRVRPGVLRADGWWAHLDAWTIPPAERLPRDRPPAS